MTQPDGPHTLNFTWLCPQSGAGADVDAFMYLCAAMDGRPRKDLPAVVLDLAALGATARTQSFKTAVELALGAYNDRAPRYPWRQNGTDEHELKSAKSREQGRRFKVALPLNRGAHAVVRSWLAMEAARGVESREALMDALTMGARVLSVAKGAGAQLPAITQPPAQAPATAAPAPQPIPVPIGAHAAVQNAHEAKPRKSTRGGAGEPAPFDDSVSPVPDDSVSLVPMAAATTGQGDAPFVENDLVEGLDLDSGIFAISVSDMDPSTW